MPQINCFVGQNGMGKTNLLDAIYYCCMGKSFFSTRDALVLQESEDFFRIEATMIDGSDADQLVVKVKPRRLKELEINGELLSKTRAIAGKYPIVIISTQDDRVIFEGSTARRRYFNNVLSQMDSDYLEHLALYHRMLKYRNATLKNDKMSYGDRRTLVMNYSEMMNESAKYITKARAAAAGPLYSYFCDAHASISAGRESVNLTYESDLGIKSLLTIHEEVIQADLASRRTLRGIHRDDLIIQMKGSLMKDYGSQGQIKTAVIALKLAQFKILAKANKKAPIIMLDDIFDRLDAKRVESLLTLLIKDEMGQIFISDTDEKRTKALIRELDVSSKVFTIHNGQIRMDR